MRKRLLTAQLVAVACFVAIPASVLVRRARPPTASSARCSMCCMGFDRPFNQMPSLHIALAVILWALYARKVRGLARILLDVWFMLIGASVLTTYQHHFIDIPTGFALGWLCVWLWPFAESGVRARCGSGAGRLTLRVTGWRFFTGWARSPASLAVRGAAGGGCGSPGPRWRSPWSPRATRAWALPDSRRTATVDLSVAARWLLAPYLAGAWLNSRWWTRRHPEAVAVCDGVWIGRMPSSRDLA